MLKLRNILYIIGVIVLLSSCARMGRPDGGWYDETPPHVIASTPADRSTDVSAKKVNIYFDEFIKLENASEKVVVSPPQLEQAEIKATGKKISVLLKDSLKPNTTYTMMKSVSGDYSAAFITRKVFFYGVLTIIPYYFIIPGFPSWEVFARPQVIGNLLFLGCLASMICFLTWNWCIAKLGAVKATNWVYFNPITTMIFASWVLDEEITPYFLMGAACILAGMYVADKKTQTAS